MMAFPFWPAVLSPDFLAISTSWGNTFPFTDSLSFLTRRTLTSELRSAAAIERSERSSACEIGQSPRRKRKGPGRTASSMALLPFKPAIALFNARPKSANIPSTFKLRRPFPFYHFAFPLNSVNLARTD